MTVRDPAHAAWLAGRSAWPTVDLEEPAFVGAARRRTPPDQSFEDWLAPRHASDLYLACACELGTRGAIEAFDQGVLSRIHSSLPLTLWEEARHQLRIKLFVAGSSGRLGIVAFDGRASLVVWARVAMLRLAIDLQRKGWREHPGNGGAPDEAVPSAETALLRARYRNDVERAFNDAIAHLPKEHRNIMRLRFVDALTLPQIAKALRLNKATVSRRIADARAQVRQAARALLSERLRLEGSTFSSLIRSLGGELDLSLSALLSSDGIRT